MQRVFAMRGVLIGLALGLLPACAAAPSAVPAAIRAIDAQELPRYWQPERLESSRIVLQPLGSRAQRRWAAVVWVEAVIDADGHVVAARARDWRPEDAKSRWAEAAVRGFRFVPAAENPERVPVRVRLKVELRAPD